MSCFASLPNCPGIEGYTAEGLLSSASVPHTATSQDDLGVDGVIILPDKDKKKVKVGGKQATESIKQQEFESGKAKLAEHERDKSMLKLNMNEKAG